MVRRKGQPKKAPCVVVCNTGLQKALTESPSTPSVFPSQLSISVASLASSVSKTHVEP